jgi:hypothetical protein
MSASRDSGFCRLLSSAHHEPIVASAASETWMWLVVEYGGPWGAKAYDEAVLPEAVRRAIDGWVAEFPGTRVQLIRRRSTSLDGEVQVLLAWSRPEHRAVRRFRLQTLDDLPSIDVPGFVAAMMRGDDPGMGEPPERPVVLVCTNGRRDRCCAKWGVPVYRELSRRDDVEAWQTTHLGGHRFAATLLTLPDGLCHGRIEPQEVDALARSLHSRTIYRLDRFRGRTALSSAAQAAEHFLREQREELRVDAVRSALVDRGAEEWSVRLTDDTGVEHRVVVVRETLADRAPPSCGKPPEPIHRWLPVSIESP